MTANGYHAPDVPRHAPERVSALVRSVLGVPVAGVEADTYGATNAVYFVALADGTRCVLRVSPPHAGVQVAVQVWAMAACAARGVPVPRVLAHDSEGRTFPEPYMIMERLPGVVLPRAGLDATATRAATVELGRQLAAIHSIRIAGFGPLERCGEGYRGRHETLWGAIAAELETWTTALAPDVLPAELAEDTRWCLDRAERRGLFAREDAVLVHGDFQFRNVLAADGVVSGVLDFDKVEAGDPVRDFAALYPGDVALVREGHNAARPNALGPRFDEKLAAYRLIGSLERLWHHARAGRAAECERTRDDARQLIASLAAGSAAGNPQPATDSAVPE